VGITVASLVVLADRYQTRTICTLDRRHFSVLRTLDDQPFDIVP
jgi:predicted nucleic acid-binding protein